MSVNNERAINNPLNVNFNVVQSILNSNKTNNNSSTQNISQILQTNGQNLISNNNDQTKSDTLNLGKLELL